MTASVKSWYREAMKVFALGILAMFASCGAKPSSPPVAAAAVPAVAALAPPSSSSSSPPSAPADPAPAPLGGCAQTPATVECQCQAGDNIACLTLAERAFGAKEHELAIVTALAVCERQDGEGCLRAAFYMDKLRLSARGGKTSKQLRASAVKRFEDGCAADRADACFRFGKLLYQGKLVKSDEPRGLELAEKGCTLQSGAACLFLAGIYGSDRGRKDEPRALALLERGCAAGHAAGCSALGERLETSDKARAAALFAKACEGDDGRGCRRSGGVAQASGDLAKATASYEKACDLEDAAGCLAGGSLRHHGKGVLDLVKARELYGHACDDDLGAACAGLSTLLAGSDGGPRNWGQAVVLARKACTLKAPRACEQAARLGRQVPDATCTKAEDCRRLCDERIWASCRRLAQLVGQSGDDSACREALDVYMQSCTNGDGASCVLAGNQQPHQSEASDWYLRGCTAKDPEACALDAFIRVRTASVNEQAKAATELKAACASKRASACSLHALVIVGAARPRAEGLWRVACDRGEGRACRRLADSLVQPLLQRGVIGLSGDDVDDPRIAQAAKQRAQRVEALWRKGCGLGDRIACEALLEATDTSDELREQQRKVFATAHPCDASERAWE